MQKWTYNKQRQNKKEKATKMEKFNSRGYTYYGQLTCVKQGICWPVSGSGLELIEVMWTFFCWLLKKIHQFNFPYRETSQYMFCKWMYERSCNIYLNCWERYEDINDHCSYTHNSSSFYFSAVQIYDLSYNHLHSSPSDWRYGRQRCQVVNMSDSQSSSPGFESRSDHHLDLFLSSPEFKSSALHACK